MQARLPPMMIPTVDYFEQTWLATRQSSLLKLGGGQWHSVVSYQCRANNQVEGVPQQIESDV